MCDAFGAGSIVELSDSEALSVAVLPLSVRARLARLLARSPLLALVDDDDDDGTWNRSAEAEWAIDDCTANGVTLAIVDVLELMCPGDGIDGLVGPTVSFADASAIGSSLP